MAERVDVDAVGHRPGHPQHPRVDGGHVDGGIGHVDRPRRPLLLRNVSSTNSPWKSSGASSRNAAKHARMRLDVLAQPRAGMLELRAVAPLDVGAHLGAEPEPEAAARHLGQLPGDLGGHHRRAGEGHRDAGQDVESGAARAAAAQER